VSGQSSDTAVFGEAFFTDPYPVYQRLRATAAPFRAAHTQDIASHEFLLFSRYRDAVAIFNCTTEISRNIRRVRSESGASPFDLHMLHRDGADHLRLRRLVGDWFSTKASHLLRAAMQEVARDLLAPLRHRSEFDFIAEFAVPLPVAVIAKVIGVPDAGLLRIRAWSLLLVDGFDSLLPPDPAARALQKKAAGEFVAFVEALIEAKRAQPDDSMLGFLVQGEGANISHGELVAMIWLLLFAGHETTVSTLGSAMWLLLSHPEQWDLLRAQPGLVPGAVEEVLRFESPAQRTAFALVEQPLSINEHRVHPGQQVAVLIGSANRDETVFEHADTFDILRNPNPHLSFGGGLHNCLGKMLARVEAQVGLQVLLDTFPRPVLRDEHPQWRRNSFVRGLASLRLAPG
jgi:cytochrome P450